MIISKSFAWSISIIWLLCLVLSVCAELTPLEFAPLSIGNPVHWVVWGFAFPASRLLQVQLKQLRRVWVLMPRLLWGGLIAIQLLWVVATILNGYQRQKLRYFLRDAVAPLEYVFARREGWSALGRADHRQGPLRVVRQGLWHTSYGFNTFRRVITAPIIPGLIWVTPIPNDSIFMKPWQVVDTTGGYLLRAERR